MPNILSSDVFTDFEKKLTKAIVPDFETASNHFGPFTMIPYRIQDVF